MSQVFRISIIAFVCLFVGFALRKALHLNSPDLAVFTTAGHWAITDSTSIYHDSPDRFLYPPPTAFLFAPLAAIPNWVITQVLWFAISVGILILIGAQGSAWIVALLFLGRYIFINLSYGQINIAILGLLILTHKHRSSCALALGSIFKIFPSLQAITFFNKRDYKTIFHTALWGIGFLAIPLLFLGPEAGIALYQEYPAALIAKGLPTYSHNQSFTALFHRIFTGAPFELFGIGLTQWQWLPISAPPAFTSALALVVGIILSILTWKTALNPTIRARHTLAPLSATCFSILFLSHIVWKPYFLLLAPPLAAILGDRPLSQTLRRPAMLAFIALTTLTSPGIIPSAWSATLDALSIHLIAALFIYYNWLKFVRAERIKSI